MSEEHKEHEHHDHHAAHHEHAEHKHKNSQVNWNNFALVIVLVFVAALVATWAGFAAGASSVPSTQHVSIDKVALASTVEQYINNNMLSPAAKAQGMSFKVSDGNDSFGNVNGFYVYADQNGQQQLAGIVYVEDNKMVVATGKSIDLNTPLPTPAAPANTTPAQTAPVKSDKPKVDLYVMSFCPYGNQAEDTFVPDFNLLKNQIDFNVHFIVATSGDTVSSLHGPNEVNEDMREACVAKYYGNVSWLNFAVYVNNNCGNSSSADAGACWTDAAKAFNIDQNKISTCVANEGVALMKANEAASNAAGAQGSPTLIINGVNSSAVYQYGNSEAYKQAICGSFNNAPAECSVTLSGNTSTVQGGSCGN